MADTVNLNNLEELEETPELIAQKAKQLADLIRASKHVYFFTGAGISTSAKIPDFRGPNGVWTAQAQKKPAPKSVQIDKAEPTFTHMAIAELIASGTIQYVVSQNIDGLHRRSGIPADKISELHGNCWKEVCWKCKREYLRTFDTSIGSGVRGFGCKECLEKVPHYCHCTKRKCDTCGVLLKDSIIHFKENLPADALGRAIDCGNKADLAVVLGSSLTVAPACDITRNTALSAAGKLVVVNLQKTPQDGLCALRVHAKTDAFMRLVMTELGIKAPDWAASKAKTDEEKRFAKEQLESKDNGNADTNSVAASDGADSGFLSHLNTAATSAVAGDNDWEDKGGYVDPKQDCPHIKDDFSAAALTFAKAQAMLSSGCEHAECGDNTENWICNKCQFVGCSRYVKKHMLGHCDTQKHCIATSLRDLNTWCYKCEAYIISPEVGQMRDMLHFAKFGEEPPKRSA